MTVKPSVFLQRLRNLSIEKCNDLVLRTLFLEKLPRNIQSVLAISKAISLNHLAADADKIFETIHTDSFSVSAINTVHSVPSVSSNNNLNEVMNALKTVTLGLSEVKKSIESLSTSVKASVYKNEYRPSRSRSSSRSSQKENFELCFYHSRFGDKATKCQPPCLLSKQTGN